MGIKRFLAAILAVAVTLSCVMIPGLAFADETAPDYGKIATGSSGSTVLYFGNDSITTSGGGSIITDSANGNVLRPDNLKVKDGAAVLTLPSVDLNGKGYDKVDLYSASKNDASVTIKVGDVTVATIASVNNGAWDTYVANTADLEAAAATASGNVTLNITGSGYCGNYVYIKFYNSSTTDEGLPTPEPEPSAPVDPSTLLPYQDTSLSFEERAADLVSRMTLEEKVTQLGKDAPAIDRLGVSKYSWWKECLHGVARQGQATSFPTSLAMSNTWNRDLFYDVAWITSDEARAKTAGRKTGEGFNLSYYTPTINMARDPRWGRNEETYGEDPYLTGQLGGEFVKGMQGDDEKYTKIIATIKHYAANNNEGYRRGGSSVMTEYNFRNYYGKVFQNVTEEVMPGSVMSSYNGITLYRNGELLYTFKPSAANYYLLTEVLRRNWGFDGYVTTDCGAGEDMTDKVPQYQQGMLGQAGLAPEAYIADALKAGMDLECNLGGGNKSVTYGVDAVLNGFITEEELETNIYHLFLQRFRTGEFDAGAKYQDTPTSIIESDEHVALAEKAAEESWVLLKNDDNILPFKSDIKNVAVVGNMANKLLLGDYTGSPTKTVTPIQGIKSEVAALNPSAEVNHLGNVSDDDKLFNVKSITLVLKDGKTRNVDLSKAESVSGMTLSNGNLLDVTPKASAIIKGINFVDVAKVKVEMSTGARIGGSLNIAYGQGGPTVAAISTTATADTDTYVACEAPYTGEDGGYNGTEDLCISASPTVQDFSVEAYKSQLDAADVIIAYAGTIPKQDGFGDSDSAESNDREDINLPSHQSHVSAITSAYPEKTIVVMSTVGQINVEPFINNCKAILWNSYNGQTQGTALGKVLTGQVNPSGKLTTTWYKNADLSKMELVAKTTKTIGGITGYFTNYDLQPTDTVDGRTYQYYKNTPVYPFGYGLSYTNFEYSNLVIDKDEVDANGTLNVSVDVKNVGTVAGKEVVQLYISHPNESNDPLIPNRQLKEFTKVEIPAGETKTVTFTLDVKDFNLFSEVNQKLYVPNGTYTIYVGKNADDKTNSDTVNVTGTLLSTLKTVKAMPNGISLNGLICEDGTGLTAATTIDAQLSAIMSDEVWVDLSAATVKYTSSNTDVATVDANGTVTSGTKEGVATITAEVTVGGVTKSDAFPVVNKLKIKPTADDIANAKATLRAEYEKLPEAAYSDANWEAVTKIYNDAVTACDTIATRDELNIAVAKAINDLNSVVMDNLTESYSIVSENDKFIEKGAIDYRDGGIPMFDGAEGTVTNAAPYTGIQLQAKDKDGNVVDNSKIIWQIKKFDDSVRKVAEVDSTTGILTVYGNGIVQLTAANIDEKTCGRLMVQINMQIEAEYADNGNGATLNDSQGTPSGGFNAGSTGDTWMEYKSVKLSNLDSIMVRYAGKNAGTINISLDKNTNPENLVAQATPNATGAWGTWATGELDLKKETLDAALLEGKLDEYGCATIYVQTNGVNLDYIRMNYIENDDEVPYVIDKVLNKTNGRMKATLSYRGSTLATEVTMVSVVKDANGTLKNIATTSIKGTGEYEISAGAAPGEDVTLYIWKSLTDITPLAIQVTKTYTTPVDSEIVVYSLNDKNFDYAAQAATGGVKNATKQFDYELNGLNGYGEWTIVNKNVSYTYSDVNEKTYNYSFTQGWQSGAGNKNLRCLYFTPKSACNVTVVFAGAKGRDMYIEQGENKITGIGVDGQITAFNLDTTDTTNPVYVYGGSSNKQLLAIIVEYYGKAETASVEAVTSGLDNEAAEGVDRPVQFTTWNGSNVVLTENDVTGETKVWSVITDDIKVQLSTDYFAEADVDYINAALKINKLAEYKGRLYAGCDNGLLAVFTDCAKCYKLKKICDIDIKNMSITDGVMTVTNGVDDIEINMSDIGGDTIAAEEARVMALNGAVLVDVRSAEEFAEKSVEGSVNIPIDEIEEGLSSYSKDTVLIFYCSAGTRALRALETAKAMGYENVYNLGSIDNLL